LDALPTLFLMCGLPGSGKTTVARRLEAEHHALRLSPDEWMARIVGTGYDEAKRAAIEALQWEIAQRVLALGLSVVLESGFWSRRERGDFRARAAELGADSKLIFLDVRLDELAERVAERNASLPPGSFRVEPADLETWARMFERPTAEELE
jgi:predicted kinase